MALTIGIDPGIKGGIFVLQQSGAVWDSVAMPTIGKDIDGRAVLEFLSGLLLDGNDAIYLEKAHAMPRQGVVSMFNYGVGYGTLLGILQTLPTPYFCVTARTWQKVAWAGINQELFPKVNSLKAAKRIFPQHNFVQPRCKKPHEGLIDAALIAYYGLNNSMSRDVLCKN